MIGGLLRPVSCSFVGPQAEAMLKEFHADRLFLAVDGSRPGGRAIHSRRAGGPVERADGKCFQGSECRRRFQQARAQERLSHWTSFSRPRLITDTRAPADFSEALRKSKIEVITA